MVDRSDHPLLPCEATAELLVAGQCGREDLHRRRAAEHVVARTEHHGHTARADLLLNHVADHPAARTQLSERAG